MFSTLQVCSYNRLDINSIFLVRLNSNLQLYHYLIILKSRNSNIRLSKNGDYQSHSRMIASLELRTSAPAPAPKISPSAELQITPAISIAIPDLRTSVPFSRVSTYNIIATNSRLPRSHSSKG